MAGRKKTETEREILELEKELKDITEQVVIAKNQIKEFSSSKESGKAYQSTMRYGILFDKTQLIKNKIRDLKQQSQVQGLDATVKFSEETCRLFLQWLKSEDMGYYKYLMMIKDRPEVLKKILAVEDDRG